MPFEPTRGGPTIVVGEPKLDEAAQTQKTIIDNFLSKAKHQFQLVQNVESKLRQDMHDDAEFEGGNQWDVEIEASRAQEGRPVITINRLPQFVRQITNQQRSSRPAIHVTPVDNGADKDTAEVIQGLIRRIEVNSDADIAYLTGGEWQARIGRGYWRVHVDFVDETSHDQDIRIEWIPNPFTVSMDPTGRKPGSLGALFAFITEDIPKDDYPFRYPDTQMASAADLTSIGNAEPNWMPGGHVRVAEYFYVEKEKANLLRIQSQAGKHIDTFEDEFRKLPPGTQNTWRVTAERESFRQKVKWAKINAIEVIDGNEEKTAGRALLGKWIPIVPVVGEQRDLDGKVDLRGIVRDAKHPQRRYNFAVTAETEVVMSAPKNPWVGYVGQFRGQERKWEQANRKNFAYLEVEPMSIGGQPAPFPQRQTAEPPIRAIALTVSQADNDMKATTGFYDASLGERGPQESGKAIIARQKQGEIANSNFLDNMGRAIRQTGRLLIDLIPKVYDEPHIRRVIGLDNAERDVMVFAGANAPPQEEEGPGKAIPRIYNLGLGRYDVSVAVGPSYQSQRQDAAANLLQLVQAIPDIFPIIGDILVGMQDWPGAKKVEERLRKALLPKELQEEEEGQKPVPPEVQREMAEMAQQLEMLGAALKEAERKLEGDALKAQSAQIIKEQELASRERIEVMKNQTEQLKTLAQIDEKQAEARLKAEITQVTQVLGQIHERIMSDQEHVEAHRNRVEAREEADRERAVKPPPATKK